MRAWRGIARLFPLSTNKSICMPRPLSCLVFCGEGFHRDLADMAGEFFLFAIGGKDGRVFVRADVGGFVDTESVGVGFGDCPLPDFNAIQENRSDTARPSAAFVIKSEFEGVRSRRNFLCGGDRVGFQPDPIVGVSRFSVNQVEGPAAKVAP